LAKRDRRAAAMTARKKGCMRNNCAVLGSVLASVRRRGGRCRCAHTLTVKLCAWGGIDPAGSAVLSRAPYQFSRAPYQ
jgi:hypothetical protein